MNKASKNHMGRKMTEMDKFRLKANWLQKFAVSKAGTQALLPTYPHSWDTKCPEKPFHRNLTFLLNYTVTDT